MKASDYVNPVYKGETYKYLGSYDSDALTMEELGESFKWSDYKLDSFIVDDNDGLGTYGLVLRYVIDKGTATGSGDGQNDPGTSGEAAPKTGDDAPLGMYILLLVTTVAAIGAVGAYKRGNQC